MDDLFKPHGSVLRNKGIGAVLYDMGLIEQWGSGIGKMLNLCSLADIPEPHFEEYQELTNISRQTATIDLLEMVKKSVFERIGKAGKAGKGIALID